MAPQGSLPHSQRAHHLFLSCARSIQSMSLSNVSKIHFNIILPSTPCSSEWSHPLRSSQPNPVRTTHLPHTYYIPRPSHSFQFYHPNDIWWGLLLIKLLVMQSSPPSVTSSLSGPNILLSTTFPETLSPHSSLNVSDQVSHPYKTTSKITIKTLPSQFQNTAFTSSIV